MRSTAFARLPTLHFWTAAETAVAERRSRYVRQGGSKPKVPSLEMLQPISTGWSIIGYVLALLPLAAEGKCDLGVTLSETPNR
jgi:hypothetical protein